MSKHCSLQWGQRKNYGPDDPGLLYKTYLASFFGHTHITLWIVGAFEPR